MLHLHNPSSESYATHRPESVHLVITDGQSGKETTIEIPPEQTNTIEHVERLVRDTWLGLPFDVRRNGATVRAFTDRDEVLRSYSLAHFAEERFGAPLIHGKHIRAAKILLLIQELLEQFTPQQVLAAIWLILSNWADCEPPLPFRV